MRIRTSNSHRNHALGYRNLPLSGTMCVSIGGNNSGSRMQPVLINSPLFTLNTGANPRVDGTDQDGCLLCINLNNWLVLGDPILCDPLVHHSF